MATFVAPSATTAYHYGVSGSTTLPNLGTVHLGPGTVDTTVDPASGQLTATVSLPPSTANLALFGFIPVTAQVVITPTGPATGSVTNGAVTADTKVNITLPHISALGVPISNSPTCRTSAPADVTLTSGPGFTLASGGALTGGYTLPPLTGCGPFTNLISAAASGPGDTITLTLTSR